MSQSSYLAGGTLAVILAFSPAVPGEEPKPGPLTGRSDGKVASLLVHPLLKLEEVQKELGLTPEQKEKLAEVATKAAEARRAETLAVWHNNAPLIRSQANRDSVNRDLVDRRVKRNKETLKQVEQILTPKQVEQLKEREFRQRATILVLDEARQEIGLTDEQKQKIESIRKEHEATILDLRLNEGGYLVAQERWKKLRECEASILGVLTQEQTKKLREISDEGRFFHGRRPGEPFEEQEPLFGGK